MIPNVFEFEYFYECLKKVETILLSYFDNGSKEIHVDREMVSMDRSDKTQECESYSDSDDDDDGDDIVYSRVPGDGEVMAFLKVMELLDD
jgi:hypothetical protein